MRTQPELVTREAIARVDAVLPVNDSSSGCSSAASGMISAHCAVAAYQLAAAAAAVGYHPPQVQILL